MLKPLHKSDTKTLPFITTKDWSLSNTFNDWVVLTEHSGGLPVAMEYTEYIDSELTISINSSCNVALEQQDGDRVNFRKGRKSSGIFYPDEEQTNIDGTYKRIVHSQVRNMFDLQYQMRLNDMSLLTTGSIVYFTQMQQHLRLLDMTFNGEQPIRFNRTTGKVYIDMDWSKATVGQFIILEGYIIIDPDTYVKLYNDRLLKKLAMLYIKKQWGSNMRKFGGLQLPGGVILNGKEIYDEAVAEIQLLEQQIRDAYEEPPAMMIG